LSEASYLRADLAASEARIADLEQEKAALEAEVVAMRGAMEKVVKRLNKAGYLWTQKPLVEVLSSTPKPAVAPHVARLRDLERRGRDLSEELAAYHDRAWADSYEGVPAHHFGERPGECAACDLAAPAPGKEPSE